MTEPSQTPEFVHLHVRSEYSIVDSTIRIPTLMSSLVKMNMWAVAVTDFCWRQSVSSRIGCRD